MATSVTTLGLCSQQDQDNRCRRACTRCLTRFLFALLLALAGWPGASQAADDGILPIRQAQVILSQAASMPADSAAWQTVALPHREKKPNAQALVGYWYKASFTLASIDRPWWVYFRRLPSGGEVYVNGHLIADIPSADAATQVRWYRPQLRLMQPLALHPGQNTIAVRLAIREPLTSFDVLEIGPEKLLRKEFDRLYFWENTLAEISAAICILAGILIALFWIQRRQEQVYGLFGMCVLFWGLRTVFLRVPVVPIDYLVLWRVTYYFFTAGFIVLIAIFMLRFSGRAQPRFTKGLIVYWLAGCAFFAIGGMALRPVMNSYWLPGFLPFTLYAIWHLFRFAMRQRSRSSLALMLSVSLALALSLHDFVVQEGWFNLSEIYLMHLAIPSFLMVMAGILSERFLSSLKKVESINEQLALQVAAREQEIAASYERVRLLERVNVATEERQRIMQDMHDGVGSQLLSALVMVERGHASREDTVTLLQECLDDMRLALDALSPGDPDLLPALGNFRFRITSRFKSLGLTLAWHNLNMPDRVEVAPHVGLSILRLLQEALANILKHAHATQVVVQIRYAAHSLAIDVIDDGVGFSPDQVVKGRGLINMRSRARKLGASLAFEPLARGTAVRLVLPLGAMSLADAPVTIDT